MPITEQVCLRRTACFKHSLAKATIDSEAPDQWGVLPQRMQSQTAPARGHASALSVDGTPYTTSYVLSHTDNAV